MAIAVVQVAKGQDTGGGTGSAAAVFASNITAGSVIIACVLNEKAGKGGISTPTDTRANTYTQVYTSTAGSYEGRFYITYNSTAGANTVTVADANQLSAVFAYEVTGLASSSAFDRGSDASTTVVTPSSGTTATTRAANELLLGIFMCDATTGFTMTVGAGYSNIQTLSQGFASFASEQQIVAATGAYSATIGSNTNGSTLAIIGTFADTPIAGAAATLHNLSMMGVGQ